MSRNDILENIFSLIKYINPRVNGIDIDKLGEAFFWKGVRSATKRFGIFIG